MKWSEKDFRARVKMHAARRGLTITEVLKRAGVTEDYLRHPPEGGRNISAILKIAEVLTVNPAELMGLELSHEERRSTMMVGQVINIMRANGNYLGKSEIEQIVVAVMAALKQYDIPAAKHPKPAAARSRPPRSE